jgi:hypothetical protein
VRDVNRPVSVGKRVCLLASDSCRKNHLGQLRCLCQKSALNHDEEILLRKYLADAVKLRQRNRRVGADDPEELD